MGDELVLLLVGFVLTSVVGGALGWFFQTRSWSHQHAAQQRDQERAQAIKVFEEVSSLLDRRLYRMRLVFWAAKRLAQGRGDAAALDEARARYHEVVTTWNDNLNRILALVHTYFGGAARQELEDRIYEEFSAIGRALEQFVRDCASPGFDADRSPIGRRLSWLGRQVYAFNVRVLELLQAEQLGRDAPPAGPYAEDPAPLLQFGHQGRAVSRLQRALTDVGVFRARVDGSFGADTEAAVRELQRSAGLETDGVVGAKTWQLLATQTDSRTENSSHSG